VRVLVSSLVPGIEHFSRPVATTRKSTESGVDLDLVKQTCLLLNTADYCQTTALEVCLTKILATYSSDRFLARREI
jgi:hypothetical protein